MSISSEIGRIRQNVSDSLSAVSEKGVAVPAQANSDQLPGLIRQIPEAQQITVDDALSASSENPVQNKIIQAALNGKVSLAGDTMTGDLTIAKANAGLYFKKTAAGDTVGGMYHVVDSGGHNRLALLQRTDGSDGAEGFFLPTPETHAAFASYGILTTKNLVTVAQGGTGAATAANARTNLGLNVLLDKDNYAAAAWLTAADTYLQSGNTSRVMEFYRRGKIVIVRGALNLSSTSTGSNYKDVGTIPSGYRPNATYYQAVPIQASTQMGAVSVSANGNIAVYHNNTDTGFLRFTMTYPLLASEV